MVEPTRIGGTSSEKAHKADQNEGTHKDGDFTGMLSLVLAGTSHWRRVVEAAQKGTSHTSLESVGEFTHSVAPRIEWDL